MPRTWRLSSPQSQGLTLPGWPADNEVRRGCEDDQRRSPGPLRTREALRLGSTSTCTSAFYEAEQGQHTSDSTPLKHGLQACEMFILELTQRSWNHSEENKRRTLQRNDIAAAITRTDIFDFLVCCRYAPATPPAWVPSLLQAHRCCSVVMPLLASAALHHHAFSNRLCKPAWRACWVSRLMLMLVSCKPALTAAPMHAEITTSHYHHISLCHDMQSGMQVDIVPREERDEAPPRAQPLPAPAPAQGTQGALLPVTHAGSRLSAQHCRRPAKAPTLLLVQGLACTLA